MRAFRVTVNGLSYEVTVEEVGTVPGASMPSPSIETVKPTNTAIPARQNATNLTAAKPNLVSGDAVYSPMPGVVLKIMVEIGQIVNCGDVLLILEAMKMENEVTASVAGTIKEIAVAKGSSVNTGDLMVVIE
ncbi:MAG: acetyl-CoA carboxylase biotin carboxyl carrier protein subunit [Clostridium sp.]|nr:acetyl-CoA carboxylase biotin carboxyl carrier protein subunit [Clostridium sp.]